MKWGWAVSYEKIIVSFSLLLSSVCGRADSSNISREMLSLMVFYAKKKYPATQSFRNPH
jgi:hypothetical protein